MMMKGSLRVARIAGIDIGIHYTWILIFVLITWSLAVGYFPADYPGWAAWLYWLTAVAAALLLFVSVLIHELAHSLVARSRGLPVKSINLFLLGGVSNIETEPEKPGVEFAVAIVGPLASIAIAGVFWAVEYFKLAPFGAAEAISRYLMVVNVLLAAFNILPGFPLDGGRVLRAIIWGATNDLKKATNIATITGQVFGWIMIAAGVFMALTVDLISGIWFVFIGWFLNSSAEASRRELELRSLWLNVRVSSVMNDRPEVVGPGDAVDKLVNEIYLRRGLRYAPVAEDGRLMGIVTLADIKKVPMGEWKNTSVSSIMTHQPLKVVSPGDNMRTAVQLMAENGLDQLPVVVDDRIVGMLGRADIIRYVQVHHELGRR
ncbi:MAG: site-2 protease family protein [Dehalococcoidia bacterium]|nr:site-2 protease family protein [Dehalococcoidia bacterium]